MDKVMNWLVVISGALAFYILAILTTSASEVLYGGMTLAMVGISLTPIITSKLKI